MMYVALRTLGCNNSAMSVNEESADRACTQLYKTLV
jgi:hypothetical protein